MYIMGLNKQIERIIDYKNVQRKRRVNGEHSLSFDVINTDRGAHAYQLIENRATILVGTDEYIIMNINKRGHYGKSVQATHIVFDNMINTYRYDVLNGIVNFKQCLDFIFQDTGWTYVIQGAFASQEFQNFGDDTSLALLQKALNEYEAEFQIDNQSKEIIFKNQIGNIVDTQFRYGYNLKTFEEETNFYNFATYIKGFTKDAAGKDVFVEYRSPLAEVYGDLPQKPVRDEKNKPVTTLLERCKKELNDTLEIKFKVSVANLFENGFSQFAQYDYGDSVYMIYDKANVSVLIRIIEIVDDPTDLAKSPVVELSTFKELRTMSAIQAQFQQTQKQVAQLLDDSGNLNLALKRLYRNSNHYSDNTGDWYISEDDPNAYVHIGAGGLDVHKGLIRVEREDGFATIIGGVLQHGFDIGQHEPPYTFTEVEGPWWTTTNAIYTDCQYYTFEHKSRYLKVLVGQFVEEGASSQVAVFAGDGQTILKTLTSTNTNQAADEARYGRVMKIDLGTPNGSEMSVYIRLKSSVTGKKAYCRKLRMWLEG